jgi:predicted Zn-dependent protease
VTGSVSSKPRDAVADAELPGRLERRAPGRWGLYAKEAESAERVWAGDLSRTAFRSEEGWAARWWGSEGSGHGLRFAAGTSPAALLDAIEDAERHAVEHEPTPEWPASTTPPAKVPAIETPDEHFGQLAAALEEASGRTCELARLAVRAGATAERIRNGAGLDVSQTRTVVDGVATVVGRRPGGASGTAGAARSGEVRLSFQGTALPDWAALARRLADAATLPLADPAAAPARGQWLLDPAVGAALLAAIAPIFTSDRPPRWLVRGRFASTDLKIVDDASPDAPFDGEGVATRRVLLCEDGQLLGGLRDLRAARRTGRPSTGHGKRSSFRTPPAAGPRRIFFEGAAPRPAAELLASVTRGLYASALTAPARIDLEADRFEVEFTGIAIVAGRARGPVAGARVSGRITELLARIRALATDLQCFPMPFPSGAPTMLVERATFE